MAKARRTRVENNINTLSIRREDIAQRAYALYLRRGAKDGHDVEDWLAAERQLREELSQKPGSNSSSSAA